MIFEIPEISVISVISVFSVCSVCSVWSVLPVSSVCRSLILIPSLSRAPSFLELLSVPPASPAPSFYFQRTRKSCRGAPSEKRRPKRYAQCVISYGRQPEPVAAEEIVQGCAWTGEVRLAMPYSGRALRWLTNLPEMRPAARKRPTLQRECFFFSREATRQIRG